MQSCGQETGWKSGLRPCIMPGLPTHFVQGSNVGTVSREIRNKNVHTPSKTGNDMKRCILSVKSITSTCF